MGRKKEAMETTTIRKWLETVLKADATLTGLVSTRIYAAPAPKDATFPMVVYQLQASEPDLTVVNGVRIWAGGVWLVRGVAKTESFATLTAIADRIDVLIHRQSGAVTGGTVVSCVREEAFEMVETVDSLQYRHLGGMYRIRAQ